MLKKINLTYSFFKFKFFKNNKNKITGPKKIRKIIESSNLFLEVNITFFHKYFLHFILIYTQYNYEKKHENNKLYFSPSNFVYIKFKLINPRNTNIYKLLSNCKTI